MIKKGLIWFLVLAFLNFIIVPDYVFAGSYSGIGPSKESVAIGVGAAIVLGLIIVGIVVLAKHSKSPTEKPQEQKQDTGISSDIKPDNRLISPSDQISLLPQDQKQDTSISLNTNLDNRLITPSGQIALLRW